jgi:hypothetical protein
MAIKDMLLPLIGNPSPGLIAAIAKCVDVAASFDAEITALAVEEDVSVRPQVMISADFPDEVASNAFNKPCASVVLFSIPRCQMRNPLYVAYPDLGDGEAEVKVRGTDLLVMGAYGHSRLSEWVWGARPRPSSGGHLAG